jgi:hypothetical protein
MNQIIDCEVGGRLYKNVHFKDMGFSFEKIKWTFWDKLTWPFYRCKRVLKDWFYACKYAFERVKDGYDSRDVFSLDYSFLLRYEKILKDFRKYNNGHPCHMTEEEWDKILDEMIYHLHYMYEENVENELQTYVKDKENSYIIVGRTVFDIMEEHRKEFFDLFSKYFYNLWY